MALSIEEALICASICALLIALFINEEREQPQSIEDELLIAFLQYQEDCTRVVQASQVKRRRLRHASRSCWAYARPHLFMEGCLNGSYSDAMFKKHMHVSKETFKYIFSRVAPHMQCQNTCMRKAINLEQRVSLGLHRLVFGANLEFLADLCGCATSTACGIVMDFCRAIKVFGWHNLYIKWPHERRMVEVSAALEAIHGILFVVGVVDRSHIPIIAPKEFYANYYNRKGFHSILLQMTVSSDCRIWDYDVGWAGSIHDSILFSRSALGKACKANKFGLYCLLGDCAYPARKYMLPPFKGIREGMSRDKAYWNFVQSRSQMAVERAFGMLKSRFRILLKRCDMDLHNVPSMVAACLVLHNMCIIHKDGFDTEWATESKSELEANYSMDGVSCTSRGQSLQELRSTTASTLVEVHALTVQNADDIFQRGQDGAKDQMNAEAKEEDCGDMNDVEQGPIRCNNIASSLYWQFISRHIHDDGIVEGDEDSSTSP